MLSFGKIILQMYQEMSQFISFHSIITSPEVNLMLFLVEGKQITKISMIIISKSQNIKIKLNYPTVLQLRLDYSSNIRHKGYKDCKVTENNWFKMQDVN